MKKSSLSFFFIAAVLVIPTQVAFAATITAQQIFAVTNEARQENNREPFLWDAILSEVAEEKLDDMFARQYFAHKDPDGKTVGAQALEHHYDYALLGENLAMGWFEDASMLVNAWMRSSGHRKNILFDRFTTIGIAVGVGEFQGEETLIAVQVFARPAAVCPPPSMELKTAIFTGQAYVKKINDLMNAYIKEAHGASTRSVRVLTNQVSAVMAVFLRQLDEKVRTYNAQVETFEKCVRGG